MIDSKEAWRREQEEIESRYKRDRPPYIGHHAEFLHQYGILRRKMKKPSEDATEIMQRIDMIYPIALKRADEWQNKHGFS